MMRTSGDAREFLGSLGGVSLNAGFVNHLSKNGERRLAAPITLEQVK